MRRGGLVLALGVAWAGLGAVGLFYRGCYSAALPPEPAASDIARVRATHFRATVGVAPYHPPVYSDRLVDSLRRTGLFDEVASLEQLPGATLIAHVKRPIYGTATIPILPAISLGLIPQTVEEEWGEAFTLTRDVRPGQDVSQRAVEIDFSYSGPTTLGWWAAIRSGLSTDISTRPPRETDRFHTALAVSICAKADEIEQLIEWTAGRDP
jgi:hypothetical protein